MPDSTTSPESRFAQWSHAAAGVLAKSRRTTPDELPDTPEAMLNTATADDGVVIKPLYTQLHQVDEPSLPGQFPYTRGADRHRDVVMGWRVTERFGDDGAPPAELNRQILDALNNGTSGLWLSATALDNLATTLDGVLLDLVPITLDSGASADKARDLLALLPATQRSLATTVSLSADPVTAAFTGQASMSESDASQLAIDAPQGVRTYRIDGTGLAMLGASDAQELACALAAAVETLRTLPDSVDVPTALASIGFAYSVNDDQFAGIAKLRAARGLWARVAQVLGAPDEGAAPIHAVTALGMMTQRDPWVNMLRTTVAAFGAGVGGADQVTVHPYDVALPAESRTAKTSFTRRMARNTQLLLLEESNLGRVIDPAGGSWFVESLTADLTTAAWELFQKIEAAGGFTEASGLITDLIADARDRSDTQTAHRQISVTGVNEFPATGEPPMVNAADLVDIPTAVPRLHRTAVQFERLRDRADRLAEEIGTRPTVPLVALGTVAENNGRTTFIANLLASGGISSEIVPLDQVTAETFTGRPITVICGADTRYVDDAESALASVRAAGANEIYVAGKAKAWPADHPHGFLAVGDDAIASLTAMLTSLETGATR